ncbi:hypothetical protein BJY16_006883 [Actinoplanes octamycinicus]|uniref:Uncharacterized protein n=1 Tax=Actinoplanes octamycinicus TaxID=135948 RepID=A0A7W7H3R3_9ACTN|nr:DUF6461 domain-containing protein [Actinoplanes octamycinicus]MBB4743424.1 hypothetical protein [Actinoplanes octamycinicus]GIE63420.1 hypothetical protein Aoc01nite_88220 [Actinoplanes octamycinicus]
MAGPTRELVEHYVRFFEELDDIPWVVGESLFWTVVRPAGVDAVLSLIGGDPGALESCRPDEVAWEDDRVFVEQRGDAVLLVGPSDVGLEELDRLRRLSRDGTVDQVFWAINNYNLLRHLAGGELVTELNTLWPAERSGADPDALNEHLGALHELDAQGDERGADLDWPTAMATMESITGFRIDVDWFRRPHSWARIKV